MSALAWYVPTPGQKYGGALTGTTGGSGVDSQLPAVAGPAVDDAASVHPLHPESPLFWFGVIAAAAVGLMAASTTARVGPLKASVAVGKP